MKRILIPGSVASILLFILGCGQSGAGSSTEPDTKKEVVYYPISDYIRGQIQYVDTSLLAVIHYTTVNGATDSSVMEKPEFKKVAEEFLEPNLNDPLIKPKYEENAFIDATIGTITLTYSTKDEKAPLWKATVLLRQEDTKPIYIYLEKQLLSPDSSVLKKMIWKADSNCQIVSIIRKPNQSERIIEDKYVWDKTVP
jgi:hypothetical protein